MLRVTIELVPQGREAAKRTIAVGTIANLGTGSPSSGNYFVDLRDAAGRLGSTARLPVSRANACCPGICFTER